MCPIIWGQGPICMWPICMLPIPMSFPAWAGGDSKPVILIQTHRFLIYTRTPVERPPSSTIIPLYIRPYFVWRTVFSVCAVLDRRPSSKRNQRPGQMELSPSRTTISRIFCGEIKQEKRLSKWLALQHPSSMLDYYNVALKHLWSNSIALNFLLIWWRINIHSWSRLDYYNVASRRHSNTFVESHLFWTMNYRRIGWHYIHSWGWFITMLPAAGTETPVN